MNAPQYIGMLTVGVALYWIAASLLFRCCCGEPLRVKANRESWVSFCWAIAGLVTVYGYRLAETSAPASLILLSVVICHWLLVLFLLWSVFWRSTAMVFTFPISMARTGKAKGIAEVTEIDSSIKKWPGRSKTRVFVVLALLVSVMPGGVVFIYIVSMTSPAP